MYVYFIWKKFLLKSCSTMKNVMQSSWYNYFEIKLLSEKSKCFWLGGNKAFSDTYIINVFPSSFRSAELNPRVLQLSNLLCVTVTNKRVHRFS